MTKTKISKLLKAKYGTDKFYYVHKNEVSFIPVKPMELIELILWIIKDCK